MQIKQKMTNRSVLNVSNAGYSRNASCALHLISTFLLHKLYKINNTYFVCFFRMKTTFHWYDTHDCLKNVQRIIYIQCNDYEIQHLLYLYMYNCIYKICINAIYSNETNIYILYVVFYNLCLMFYIFLNKLL